MNCDIINASNMAQCTAGIGEPYMFLLKLVPIIIIICVALYMLLSGYRGQI